MRWWQRLAAFLVPAALHAVFDFLVGHRECDPGEAARALWEDYNRTRRGDPPVFLRAHLDNSARAVPPPSGVESGLPPRQLKHLIR